MTDFLDARNTGDGQRRVSDFVRSYTGLLTFNKYCGQNAGACTVNFGPVFNLTGPTGRHIIVLNDFWGGMGGAASGATQALTLIHELLHAHFNAPHAEVARALRINVSSGASDSQISGLIDQWLLRGCHN